MLIAEYAQVVNRYPGVATGAVERLLWALHRIRPVVEANRCAAAATLLRADLAGYPGDVNDLALLSVPALFAALEQGKYSFALALGAAGMLAVEPDDVKRWVIVGDLLAVRTWARKRAIAFRNMIPVTRAGDVARLHGLIGQGLAIVRLDDRIGGPGIDNRLSLLIAQGAITVSPHWEQGRPRTAGEPRLDAGRRP